MTATICSALPNVKGIMLRKFWICSRSPLDRDSRSPADERSKNAKSRRLDVGEQPGAQVALDDAGLPEGEVAPAAGAGRGDRPDGDDRRGPADQRAEVARR